MYTIRLAKSGKTFDAAPGEMVLDAADRAGIHLPSNCRAGTCRTCRTRVISGCVEHEPELAPFVNLERAELDEGYRLLCSAYPCSDAELDR
jgi:ferredoxin